MSSPAITDYGTEQFGVDGPSPFRRPSIPFSHHTSSLSTSTLYSDAQSVSRYAPSSYAQSTIAASTIMPNVLHQPVQNSATEAWVEGHCLRWQETDDKSLCSVCEEKADEGIYRCHGKRQAPHRATSAYLPTTLMRIIRLSHDCTRSMRRAHLPGMPGRFRPRSSPGGLCALLRQPPVHIPEVSTSGNGRTAQGGKLYRFNMDGFLKSIPRENAQYVHMLQQTQGMYRISLFCRRVAQIGIRS